MIVSSLFSMAHTREKLFDLLSHDWPGFILSGFLTLEVMCCVDYRVVECLNYLRGVINLVLLAIDSVNSQGSLMNIVLRYHYQLFIAVSILGIACDFELWRFMLRSNIE